MAQEEFEYRNHRIAVETFSERGRLSWIFRIGDEKPVELKRSPASNRAEAFAEAISAARSVLDLREGAG